MDDQIRDDEPETAGEGGLGDDAEPEDEEEEEEGLGDNEE
jgi:hypothetical protein